MSYRIGVDIGGTFTDFIAVDDADGGIVVEKLLTSGHTPDVTVLAGLDRLQDRDPSTLHDASAVIHATTLVTNVILERKGARTGLVTTAGFRDILEIAREVRYDIFDMFIRMPEPLVPRHLRFGVRERLLADGTVREALVDADVRAAARALRDEGVQAVAVVFLHSYRDPAHELRAAEILAEELPGVPVSLSHRVHPEPKEYERSSTTAVDAYVKAVVATYLDRIEDGLPLRGYGGRLLVMLSNGGTATVETAKSVPVQMVESGPAAGVEAAAFFGRLLDLPRVLSFDMGGTTAKLCLIEDGRAARSRTFEVDRVHRFKAGSGLPVAVPVYDLLEIGAGGGSVAHVNSLGLLQVGPDSAGAAPGPACYGSGGAEPTVTDADLVLGLIDAGSFLGGSMRLDAAAAREAIRARLAEPLGLGLEQAAAGVHELVNETMASAARMYVAEKGKDPSELVMIAMGGAGPVHALGLARKLGCARVVVPPLPGVMSALGLLVAPIAFERSHAVRALADAVEPSGIEALFDALEGEARALMPEGSSPNVRRSVDIRFSGQDHALEVDAEPGPVGPDAVEAWKTRFKALYDALYGKVDDDNPIEIANVRVSLAEPMPAPRIVLDEARAPARPIGERPVSVDGHAEFVRASVYARSAFAVGQAVAGPAIVEEREATTVLHEGDRLVVDRHGCLVIDVATAASEAAVDRVAADPAAVRV